MNSLEDVIFFLLLPKKHLTSLISPSNITKSGAGGQHWPWGFFFSRGCGFFIHHPLGEPPPDLPSSFTYPGGVDFMLG